MDNQTVTDLSYLREIAMGDNEIIIETTQVFLQEMPQNLENMQEHFANQEWEKMAKLAHRIKPNMAYMGMENAEELILKIEQQARSGNISEDLGQIILEFKGLCNKARDELSEKLEKLESK